MLAVLLVPGACKAPPPPVVTPVELPVVTPTPTPAEIGAERGAFVLLMEHGTVVLPFDPTIERLELPGQWVGAQPEHAAGAWGRVPVEVVGAQDSDLRPVPVCASGSYGDPCELPVEHAPADRRAALESASASLQLRVELVEGRAPRQTLLDPVRGGECSCVVVPWISADGEPVPEFDLEDPVVLEEIAMSPYDPEEYVEHCSTEALLPDLEPTAYVGGVLYANGMSHNGVCSGLNLYDGASDTVVLRPGSTEPNATFFEGACSEGLMDPHAEIDLDGEPGVPCDDDDEMLAYAIERGQLVRTTGSIGTVGEECSCVSALPLSAVSCPSLFDPCGDRQGFPGLADASRWWVSSDGRRALRLDDEELSVWAPGEAEPLRRDSVGEEILGVEVHARSVLLEDPEVPEVMRAALPPLSVDDRGFAGSAKDWGNRCFGHLRAGLLDAAEAACFAGLVAGGSDGTRGAITYNLGRIEEARGDQARALTYYERSDRLRPGNATVQERIQALRGG